jgi:LPS-assembly lipoprotein
MWWLERDAGRRLLRFAGVIVAGAALAGCFQPLYGSRSFTSTPGIADALKTVDVSQIATPNANPTTPNGSPEARVAVELRNQLLTDLTGGGAAAPPAYRLTIRMKSEHLSVIVDTFSGRPDAENYGLSVNYSLVDLKSGKAVFTSNAFSRVSYDVPGEAQRFAEARAQRDAENRAAKEVADSIRARLASFFVAGT